MNFIQAILMGIVQGLSEFLPISSSAHLVFTSNFYKVIKNIPIVQSSNEEVFFDIMVHLGTLIAVLIFFRKDVLNILKAMWHAIKTKNWEDKEAKLGLFIMAGTVITVMLALPINEIAEKVGLENQRYFCQVFKKYNGISASEYRSRYGTIL